MSVKNDTRLINGFNEYNFNVYIMRRCLFIAYLKERTINILILIFYKTDFRDLINSYQGLMAAQKMLLIIWSVKYFTRFQNQRETALYTKVED